MFYKLYVRDDCGFCKRAIQFLTEHKIEHVACSETGTQLIEEMKKKYDWPTVPIVIEVDDTKETLIGGYTDMRKYFKNKGVKNV